MIVNVLATEKIDEQRFKIVAKEGEFYSKENGLSAGQYDIETKPMVMKGQQVKVITSISAVKAGAGENTEKKSHAGIGSSDKMSKAEWAQKDRAIIKQTAMKSVHSNPGFAMLAATKSTDDVAKFYADQFKAAMRAFDEVE